MYNLDKRKLLIIKHLIDYKRPISSETLASVIGSNSRTVRDDLKIVDAFLRNFGAAIEMKVGMGYVIRFEDFDEYQTFMQVFREKYADDGLIPSYNKERIEKILRALLMSDWVKSCDLAELLYISKTTFNADIREVRALLKNYHLELRHKPNYGFSIAGEERHIRVLLSDYLYGDEEDGTDVENVVLRCGLDSKTVRDALASGFRKHRVHVSADSLDEIINLIVATAMRRELGFEASLTTEQTAEVASLRDTPLLRGVLRKIWAAGPETELDILTLYIQSRRIYGFDDPFSARSNGELYALFDAIKNHVAGATDSHIIMGEPLAELIPRVLKSLLLRVRFGYECRGMKIVKMKSKNPIYDFAALICQFVSERYRLPISESEIARFAHEIQQPMQSLMKDATVLRQEICLIAGYGKNGGLVYRQTLLDTYPEYIKRVTQCEFYEIDNKGRDYDLLVTDIPKVKFDVDVPVFQIKHGLSERERKHLRAIMGLKQERAERFLSFFSQENCRMGLEASSSAEILREVAFGMERTFDLPGFCEECCAQDAFFSSERGNNAAICHSMRAMSEHTHIAVAILKRPILWKRELVSVAFVVAPGREEKVLYESVSNLAALMTDIDLIHEMRHAASYEELLRCVRAAYERSEVI